MVVMVGMGAVIVIVMAAMTGRVTVKVATEVAGDILTVIPDGAAFRACREETLVILIVPVSRPVKLLDEGSLKPIRSVVIFQCAADRRVRIRISRDVMMATRAIAVVHR